MTMPALKTGDLIKSLREAKGKTQDELAKELNIAQSTLANYESNVRTPKYDNLSKFADYFNVTTDYLLGRDERVSSVLPMSEFSKRIKNLLYEKEMSQKELAQHAKTTPATISRILNDERNPSIDIASSIAESLDVSVDYLLGRTDERNISTTEKRELTEEEKYIMEMGKKLGEDPELKGMIDDEFIKFIMSNTEIYKTIQISVQEKYEKGKKKTDD